MSNLSANSSMLCNSARLTKEIRNWSRAESHNSEGSRLSQQKERENKLLRSARQRPTIQLQTMMSGSPVRFITNTEIEDECRQFHERDGSSSRNSTIDTPTFKKHRPSPLITKEYVQSSTTSSKSTN